MEHFADVEGLAAVRGAAAAVAVADELKKSGGSPHIAWLGSLQQDGLYLRKLRWREVMLRQLQFFFQVFGIKLALFKKAAQDIEFIP